MAEAVDTRVLMASGHGDPASTSREAWATAPGVARTNGPSSRRRTVSVRSADAADAAWTRSYTNWTTG